MEQQLILAPVRLKIEEGAKGEIKVSVAIDGENEDILILRITNAYKKLKSELEVK